MRETPTDATTLNSFARTWSVAIFSHNVDVGDLADAAGDNGETVVDVVGVLTLRFQVKCGTLDQETWDKACTKQFKY